MTLSEIAGAHQQGDKTQKESTRVFSGTALRILLGCITYVPPGGKPLFPDGPELVFDAISNPSTGITTLAQWISKYRGDLPSDEEIAQAVVEIEKLSGDNYYAAVKEFVKNWGKTREQSNSSNQAQESTS
jgi:hypothetical protein